MPYYEFYCPANHTVYTFFARSIRWAGRVPRCPDPAHADAKLEKRVSRFAFTGVARESGEEGMTDFEDPRMMQSFAAMEREFAGLSEENPDPRQLGRLLRRMGDLMGTSWNSQMEEMARRLEAGEDPEKIEEQFGDALDESMGGSEDEGMGLSEEVRGDARRMLARYRSLGPRRDPRVYEMADYLDPDET